VQRRFERRASRGPVLGRRAADVEDQAGGTPYRAPAAWLPPKRSRSSTCAASRLTPSGSGRLPRRRRALDLRQRGASHRRLTTKNIRRVMITPTAGLTDGERDGEIASDLHRDSTPPVCHPRSAEPGEARRLVCNRQHGKRLNGTRLRAKESLILPASLRRSVMTMGGSMTHPPSISGVGVCRAH
jgi:hypothetical protein